MALFKVYRGNETNLPAAMNDGWAYFCTDSGNFYIDWFNGSALTRTQINANYASNLKYLDGDEIAEIDATTLIQGFTVMWQDIAALKDNKADTTALENAVAETITYVDEAVAGAVENKVDKETGKGLSTNDYTTVEKEKLAGIADGATRTIIDSALSSDSENPVQNKILKTELDSIRDLIGDTPVASQIASGVNDAMEQIRTEIPVLHAITNDEIDAICNASIYNAREVVF